MVWHVYANRFKNTQKLICVNCQPLVYFSCWQFKWVGFVYTLIMHWHLNVPNRGMWACVIWCTSAMVWHVYANRFKNTQKLICVNCQPLVYFSGWQFTWVGFWLCTGTQTCRTEACELVLFDTRPPWSGTFTQTGLKNTQKLICVHFQSLAYFSGWQFKWVGFVYTLIMHWHSNVPNRGMWACVIWCTSAMVWHVYANGFVILFFD